MKKLVRGFTLIELLIVVAIIAILAAIAVPNFLEAQARSKVSRVKSDMRTLATGLESYHVDNGRYPQVPTSNGDIQGFPGSNCPFLWRMNSLTSPVAYLTSIPVDPFHGIGGPVPTTAVGKDPRWQTYIYSRGDMTPVQPIDREQWLLNSAGPFRIIASWSFYSPAAIQMWEHASNMNQYPGAILPARYDPTNGTVSNGGIYRWGPGGTTIN